MLVLNFKMEDVFGDKNKVFKGEVLGHEYSKECKLHKVDFGKYRAISLEFDRDVEVDAEFFVGFFRELHLYFLKEKNKDMLHYTEVIHIENSDKKISMAAARSLIILSLKSRYNNCFVDIKTLRVKYCKANVDRMSLITYIKACFMQFDFLHRISKSKKWWSYLLLLSFPLTIFPFFTISYIVDKNRREWCKLDNGLI